MQVAIAGAIEPITTVSRPTIAVTAKQTESTIDRCHPSTWAIQFR